MLSMSSFTFCGSLDLVRRSGLRILSRGISRITGPPWFQIRFFLLCACECGWTKRSMKHESPPSPSPATSTTALISVSVRALVRNKGLGVGGHAVPQTQRGGLFHLPLQLRRSMSRVSATHDEEASARAAAATADTGAPTIFDKIIAKEIPSSIVYEDEKVLAFRDINPQAPVHVLVIPKLRDGLTDLGKAEERHRDILGELLYAAKIVAEKEGILDGFRVVINSGPAACKSICLPSSLACSWWETDEMAAWLDQNQMPVDA
ncbi:hypothetical protein RHGRI_037146 [Rhododendron griersonianum]|uniref:HIT domain-containing protein n=1 Tax=Rhododendron griersonianum TaxID=479676 RepID=A0AAV6HRQ5_9ERIC|nr:hypothetical protein RHGRI_037146 [Rhododendron griersonianum]